MFKILFPLSHCMSLSFFFGAMIPVYPLDCPQCNVDMSCGPMEQARGGSGLQRSKEHQAYRSMIPNPRPSNF